MKCARGFVCRTDYTNCQDVKGCRPAYVHTWMCAHELPWVHLIAGPLENGLRSIRYFYAVPTELNGVNWQAVCACIHPSICHKMLY